MKKTKSQSPLENISFENLRPDVVEKFSKDFTIEEFQIIDKNLKLCFSPNWSEMSWRQIKQMFKDTLTICKK